MENRYLFILITFFLVFDAVALNCSYSLLYYLDLVNGSDVNLVTGNARWILLNLSWVLASLSLGMYSLENVQTFKNICIKSLWAFPVQVLMLLIIAVCSSAFNGFDKYLITTLLGEFLAISLVRTAIYLFEPYYFKKNAYKKKVAIIGEGGITLKLEKYFLANKLTYNLTGTYQNSNKPDRGSNGINELKNAIMFAGDNRFDEVYTNLLRENSKEMEELLELAEQHCIRVKYVTSFLEYRNPERELSFAKYKLKTYYDGIPVLVSRFEPLNIVWNRVAKRGFDILFSLMVIIFLLSWLMPIMMLLIRLESKGAMIFTQLRSGKNNKTFSCYKFRSMRVNANSDSKQAIKGDARITKIGSFMRKTSLDEFPQFFNVLLGNMSIVGPRPHMLKHTEQYRETINHYMVRHYVKPGITGWAQVNGFRGETKEHRQMLGRVEHDVWYMENWFFAKDIEIIYKTVMNVAKGEENAY